MTLSCGRRTKAPGKVNVIPMSLDPSVTPVMSVFKDPWCKHWGQSRTRCLAFVWGGPGSSGNIADARVLYSGLWPGRCLVLTPRPSDSPWAASPEVRGASSSVLTAPSGGSQVTCSKEPSCTGPGLKDNPLWVRWNISEAPKDKNTDDEMFECCF